MSQGKSGWTSCCLAFCIYSTDVRWEWQSEVGNGVLNMVENRLFCCSLENDPQRMCILYTVGLPHLMHGWYFIVFQSTILNCLLCGKKECLRRSFLPFPLKGRRTKCANVNGGVSYNTNLMISCSDMFQPRNKTPKLTNKCVRSPHLKKCCAAPNHRGRGEVTAPHLPCTSLWRCPPTQRCSAHLFKENPAAVGSQKRIVFLLGGSTLNALFGAEKVEDILGFA